MCFILGIDTSSIDIGIGLFQDSEPIASYSRFIRNSHAEHIAQVVEMLLEINNVNSGDIKHIAVSVGPGSFTGLRIGISFVKGFCFKRDAVVLPVSSLEILSYAARNHSGRIISAIDARNDDVFFGSFEAKNGIIHRLTEDSIVNISDFKSFLCKDDIVVTDKMGFSRSVVFNSLNNLKNVLPVEQYHLQRGLFCSLIGAQSLNSPEKWKSEMEIIPNYLRSSSAQKQLKASA